MKEFLLLVIVVIFLSPVGFCQENAFEKCLERKHSFIVSTDKVLTEFIDWKNLPPKMEIDLSKTELNNQLKSATTFYEKDLDYNFEFEDTITFDIQQKDTLKVRMYVVTGTSIVGVGAMLEDTTQTDFKLKGEDFLWTGFLSDGRNWYYIYAVDFYIMANNSPKVGKYEHNLLSFTFKTTTSLTNCAPPVRKLYIDVIPNDHKKVDICEGDVYTLKNKNYNQSQIIYDTLTTSPSITTDVYKLTVHELDTITNTVTICQGEEHNGWTQTGEYIENYKSQYGCDSVIITNLVVEEFPQKPIIDYYGDLNICEGDYIYLNAPTGFDSYEWNTGYKYRRLKVSESGDYSVQVSTNAGCESEFSNIVTVTVHPVPEDPVITQDMDTLSTTAVGNYQWYLENQKIEGATNQNLAVPKTGNYKLKITNDGGCSSQYSNKIYVVKTATNELKFTENISVYPNPYNDVINIKGLKGNKTTIQVYDSFGKIVHTKNVISDSYSVNLSGLPAGAYYLKLGSEYGTINYKVIKK